MLYWFTLLQTLLALLPGSLPIANPSRSPQDADLRSLIAASLTTPNRGDHGDPHDSNSVTLPAIAPLTSNNPQLSPQIELKLAQIGATAILSSTAIGIVGIIVLLLLGFWAYTRVYQITPNNEAFVRTGGFLAKKNTVILYGGCIVLPGFHELTRVPMREITIDVERTGNLAVRTQDYLRANMRVTFYVCVNHDEQDVKTAAARLSKDGSISPAHIKEALEKRADDAIRAAAKRKTLAEIDSDKLGFADEVLNLIQQDLKKVGLTLNNIAISEIEESDTYDTNNFFDAQGVKLRTETIQKAIQQKEEVELTTEQERRDFQLTTQLKIKQQEIEARKKALELEQDEEDAQLQQQLEVEALRAQRAREIQDAKDTEAANQERTKILQQQSIEEEQIRKKLAVQESEIAAEIALEEQKKNLKIAQSTQKQEAEMAEIAYQQQVMESQIASDIALEEQQKKFNIAKTKQQQEAEVAEIQRKQTIEANQMAAAAKVAEARQLSEVTKQAAEIAIAEKEQERLVAEALRARAEAAVATATALEQAEREQQLVAIEAEREAAKQRIADNNVVEIEVFRRRRQAESARQAADLEAESIRTLADANREKALAEAEAEEAKIRAGNAINTANLAAELIREIAPQLVKELPAILKALAPQPGVLGDAKIYSFPSGAGSADEIGKLMLSTSGMTVLNSLLEEGQIVRWIDTAIGALRANGTEVPASLATLATKVKAATGSTGAAESTGDRTIVTPPASPETTDDAT
jgi:uncharacterized membrane protein YqiK